MDQYRCWLFADRFGSYHTLCTRKLPDSSSPILGLFGGTSQIHADYVDCKSHFAGMFLLTLVPFAIRAALVAFKLE